MASVEVMSRRKSKQLLRSRTGELESWASDPARRMQALALLSALDRPVGAAADSYRCSILCRPATNTQLHELSALTSDYAAYKEIMPLIWKRMGEPARNWRTIYKVRSSPLAHTAQALEYDVVPEPLSVLSAHFRSPVLSCALGPRSA